MMLEKIMFRNREELTNARQHLHVLQTKVERTMSLLVLRFEIWKDEDDYESSLGEVIEQCLESLHILYEHFKQVSVNGLLERAITQHPSLTPILKDIEKWQLAIVSDFRELITELESEPICPERILQHRHTIRRLQNEILAEGKQERHLLERGWT
jgi:hypothetical protein